MIVDFHTHIFPPQICQNRTDFFQSESAFKTIYQSPKSRLVSAPELLNIMDESEVDKAVIFGFPWRNIETIKLHNDYIIEMVQKYSNRFIGLCCFEPSGEQTIAETERCLAGGLSGVGELAFYDGDLDEPALDLLAPIMAMCAERNLPVLIHTNEPVGHQYPGKTSNTLAQIYQLIKRFKKNKIVLAHWGGGLFFFSLMKKEVKDCLKNVYFDTAATPYLYDPEVYQIAAKLVGDHKILFGSDYPLLPPARYFSELGKAGLTEKQIKKICGENSKQLFNFETLQDKPNE